MSTLLSGKNKAEIIDLIEQACRKLLFPNSEKGTAFIVQNHLTMMRTHPQEMLTQFKFETVPQLQLTRIVIETSFREAGQ